MITADDEKLLLRAIGIAARAVAMGDAPYGSLLAGPDGTVLIEAHNTVRRDNDLRQHPELKLALWAARNLSPRDAARTTLYTSCQPCSMCAGGIVRSGLGRVAYALSTEQLIAVRPEPGGWPAVEQDGPAPTLFEAARIPVDDYYRDDR